MVIALLTSCEEGDKYSVVVDTDDLICYVEYTTDSEILYIRDDAFDANIIAHKWHDGVGRIYFDKPIKKIGYEAFSDYSSLTSINIPDSVTSIGGSAFYNCDSLTSIDIPDSVTSIGTAVFCYCRSLTSVYCRATTPPQLGSIVFTFNATGRKIYVPRNSVNAYKSDSRWKDYAAYIVGYDFE